MKASVGIILIVVTSIATWEFLKYIDHDKTTSTNISTNHGWSDSKDINDRSGSLPDVGLPSDYFPTKIGTRWVYDITGVSTNNQPLRHEISNWPTAGEGGGTKVVETRGIIYHWSDKNEDNDGKNKLILQIESKTDKQGPMRRTEGYKIKIERDDLNIYDRATGVFWAISHGRYEVIEVVTRDPQSSYSLGGSGGPWGSMNDVDGYSYRFVLFGEKPMIALGFSTNNDSLLFVGFEKLAGIQCLHFQRIVDESKKKTSEKSKTDTLSYLEFGFTEDVWYGKGIGLMKLVQKVHDKVTMTWTLER